MIRDRLTPEDQADYDQQWMQLNGLRTQAARTGELLLAQQYRKALSALHNRFSGKMLPEPPPRDPFDVLCDSYAHDVLQHNNGVDENTGRFIRWLMDSFDITRND